MPGEQRYTGTDHYFSGPGSIELDLGIKVKRTATAGDYNVTETDVIIGVTDTSAPRTIGLPSSIVADGKIVIIKDESGGAGTNAITISTESGETIDGNPSTEINTDYGVIRLYSDGSNWFTW